MSLKAQFETLFSYHWHTARRLLACAERLDAADYTANPGYGRGSIHDLLFHVLRADQVWRLALELGRRVPGMLAADFPDLDSLRTALEDEQSAWDTFLGGLSDEAIQADVSLTDRSGDVSTLPRWRVLQHCVLHGMQHYTEIAALLTAGGQSPGDIDFIFYA